MSDITDEPLYQPRKTQEQPHVPAPTPAALPELKIYLIAGEASGDLIGGHLMQALKSQMEHPLLFYGVGGDRMEEQGLTSLFPYHELSLFGLVELLPYVIKLLSRIELVIDDIQKKRPDIVITIDSPGFCFRVIEKLRNQGYKGKCLHYVAPTVWAYKPQRAAYCARLFDHMLVLMSFEKPYFDKETLPCTWTGHPVVVETDRGNGGDFRRKYEIPDSTTLFCLLPGSRKKEIERHMPVFAKAMLMLAPHYPDLGIVVAVPRAMMEYIAPYFQNCPFRAIITANDQDKKDAIAASNIAFVKSGTVALEVAMAGTPMVVAYRVNPLSALWFRRQSLITHVNLINIIQKREIFPELLQERCNPLLVANAAAALLNDPKRQQQQTEQTQEALQQFTPPGQQRPSDIASQAIMALMGIPSQGSSR